MRFLVSWVLIFSVSLFGKPALETLEDLREIESKMVSLTERVTPAVVLIQSRRTGASGSGVVVNEAGLILTAAHVTARSKRVSVVFPDGTEAWGQVLGANYSRDISMVQLDEELTWPFAEVVDSQALEVGDVVVAMGHPKGYDPTRRPPVRFGRVLAKGRGGFVTTDCTLIGGDSGGPLFDLEGRVVAIHSNISLKEKGINNHAGTESYLRNWEVLQGGKEWGRLGAFLLPRAQRPVLGVLLDETPRGLKVVQVLENSPAWQVGLRVGDLIETANKQRVQTMEQFQELVADFVPGDLLELNWKRGEAVLSEEVELVPRLSVY